MRNITPIGKKKFVGKKFKTAGPNELSASDKNFIKNNINQYNKQQLAFKIGKTAALVEKFIKKEKLISTIENQEGKELNKPIELIEVLTPKYDSIESSEESNEKKRKRSEIVLKKINFIKENYQKYSAIELAKELNTAITGIRYHLKNLNLTPLKKIRNTTEIESEVANFVKENYQKYTVIELSEKLNCRIDSVRYYLRKYKLIALRVSKSKEVSPQVIDFLKVNYRMMTAREMSNALGNVSWNAVKYLCEKHDFLKTSEETKAIRNRWGKIEFTTSEEEYIIKNHGRISFAEIANNIQRTRSSVINFLARKGKKITKEQHNELNRRNFEKARMKSKENAQILTSV
jgi:hypothetical protein